MRVEVYWNLHKKCWSVRHKGKVIAHERLVDLIGVTWVVQPAGNARVRREKRKNVHAFARGIWIKDGVAFFRCDITEPNMTTYNPYENTAFMHGSMYPTRLRSSYYARLATLTNHMTNEKKPRAYAIGAEYYNNNDDPGYEETNDAMDALSTSLNPEEVKSDNVTRLNLGLTRAPIGWKPKRGEQ